MSTKTIGVVGRGSGWQKVGIRLGSVNSIPTLSQPGLFQSFAPTASTKPKSSLRKYFKPDINRSQPDII